MKAFLKNPLNIILIVLTVASAIACLYLTTERLSAPEKTVKAYLTAFAEGDIETSYDYTAAGSDGLTRDGYVNAYRAILDTDGFEDEYEILLGEPVMNEAGDGCTVHAGFAGSDGKVISTGFELSRIGKKWLITNY